MNKIKTIFTNKQLYHLLLPLIVEQLLAITVGLADSIMVASVGEAAVSAVSLVDTVNTLMFYGFAALATGGAVVCGQFIGRKDMKKAGDSAQQLLVFILLLACIVTAILYIAKKFILRGLFGSIEEDVMAYSNLYYIIVEASIPFIALYNAGAALFRVMGNSAVSMRISIGVNLINVCGNAFLIFGMGMGVEGVAIPTLTSRVVGAICVIWLLRNEKYPLHIDKKINLHLSGHIVKNILRIGVPSGLESSLFHLGKILLLSVVSAFGTASIAANAIGNTLATFQILPAQAIGVGMITVVSQCVGAKDFDGARYYTKKLMKWAYLSMIAVNLLIFLAMPLLIDLYNVSPEAAHLAKILLWLHGGLGVLLWPLSFTLPQALKAAGDTTFVMATAVLSMWLFRIVAGVWFAKYLSLGVLGIWLAMFIDWIVRIIVFLLRYHGSKWQEKYIS